MEENQKEDDANDKELKGSNWKELQYLKNQASIHWLSLK